ncbi:MAG: hypothetical protein QJR00_06235 [Bacillota bacterium]|nr:hypothetical protein [Bacillota bacterium]
MDMEDGVECQVSYVRGLLEGQAGEPERILRGFLTILDGLAARIEAVERRQDWLETALEGRERRRTWSMVCPHCRVVLHLPDQAWDEEGHLEWVCPVCHELIQDDSPEFEAYTDEEHLEN